MSTTVEKLASELTVSDIGKRIHGYHGARGRVSGKPMRSWCTIKSIKFTEHFTHVTVWRSPYTENDTRYDNKETVQVRTFGKA